MGVAELNLAGVNSEFDYVIPERVCAMFATEDAWLDFQLVIVEELLEESRF